MISKQRRICDCKVMNFLWHCPRPMYPLQGREMSGLGIGMKLLSWLDCPG